MIEDLKDHGKKDKGIVSTASLDTVPEITMNNRGEGGESAGGRRARGRSTSRSYCLCRKGRRSIRTRCEESSISFCECGTRGTSCIFVRDASSWLRHISQCEVCEFALSGRSASFGEVGRGKDL